MNTLWSFGGSYATTFNIKDQRINGTWIDQIAEQLEYNNKTFGLPGSTGSYTFAKFYEIRNLIQPNDVVVICLNDTGEWFFLDRPQITGFQTLFEDKINKAYTTHEEQNAVKKFLMELFSDRMHKNYTTNEEKEAVKQYMKYLTSTYETLNTVYLHNFLESLNRIAKEKNVKIIVLQTNDSMDIKKINEELPNIHIADGCLLKVSENEVPDENIAKEILLPIDRRIAHLLKRNHTILANKILNYLNNNESIDLNTEFFKNIVDKEFVENTDLCKLELFEN